MYEDCTAPASWLLLKYHWYPNAPDALNDTVYPSQMELVEGAIKEPVGSGSNPTWVSTEVEVHPFAETNTWYFAAALTIILELIPGGNMATPFLNHWDIPPTILAVRKLRFDPVQIFTVPSVNTSAAFASGIITGTIGYLFANTVITLDEAEHPKEFVSDRP